MFSYVKQGKEISNKTIYCVKSNNEMQDKTFKWNKTLSQINQAGNIKGACTIGQQNTKSY